MSWTITPQTKVPVDPQYGSVSLLLHGNGTNGSTTITDNSPSPKNVVPVGSAQISTTQSKFGGASISIPGSGSSLTSTTNNDFVLGGNDFTIETWVYVSSYPVAYPQIVAYGQSNPISYSDLSWAFGVRNTGALYFEASSGDAVTPLVSILTGSASIPSQSWAHVAITRSGNTFRTFANGTLANTVTQSGSFFLPSSSILRIGGTANVFNGYIDDLRITKGIARYTANFTPPAAPFPDI
jgi:hypothetical protein